MHALNDENPTQSPSYSNLVIRGGCNQEEDRCDRLVETFEPLVSL